eukprot:gene30608-39879_t
MINQPSSNLSSDCRSFRLIKPSVGLRSSTKLRDIVTATESSLTDGSLFSFSINDLQNTLIIFSGLAYYLNENKPRGNSREDLLEVRKSVRIPNNLGVFAKTFIPTGTVIGEYPGFVKTFETFKNSKIDEKAYTLAKKYTWQISEDKLLDPTDQNGYLGLEITYIFGILKMSTTLARLNEPPQGYDVSAYTRITADKVEVVTEKDIFADEEIYIDYGYEFDRSDYPVSSTIADNIRLTSAAEKEKMLELQPVTTSSEGVFDQDTTMPDGGFLSKLTKQEQVKDKYRKSGILSPEEGVRLFSEVGESMFGDAEDLELIESITGKKTKTASPSSPSAATSTTQPKYKSIADEEDFLRSMMGGSAVTKIPTSSSSSSSSQSSPPPEKKSPPLSPEEAADLQSRLDQLSDEQVEKVFKKMRESLGDKLREELKASMDGKRAKGMPKAPPVNPAVREQFADEFQQVEAELEKMYSNPTSE